MHYYAAYLSSMKGARYCAPSASIDHVAVIFLTDDDMEDPVFFGVNLDSTTAPAWCKKKTIRI
jgi:hypothetical protein